MTATTPQSRKSRGRKFQQYIRDKLLETFPLEDGDVRSTSMGASGEDLLLSPKAREYFPFSVEAKNQETTKIWEWWEQTKANAEYTPCLIFKRNRSDVLAVVRLDDLLEIIKENNK